MSSGTRRVSPLASDFFLLFSLTPDVRRARRRGLLKVMSPETPKQLVPSVHLTHVWRTLGDMVPWPWPSQTGDIPAAFSQGIWLCGQRSVSTAVGGGGQSHLRQDDQSPGPHLATLLLSSRAGSKPLSLLGKENLCYLGHYLWTGEVLQSSRGPDACQAPGSLQPPPATRPTLGCTSRSMPLLLFKNSA